MPHNILYRDPHTRYPERMEEDVRESVSYGCDVDVFMVFNNYTAEAEATEGHEFSGFAVGGPCEGEQGRGYVAIVDQGISICFFSIYFFKNILWQPIR